MASNAQADRPRIVRGRDGHFRQLCMMLKPVDFAFGMVVHGPILPEFDDRPVTILPLFSTK